MVSLCGGFIGLILIGKTGFIDVALAPVILVCSLILLGVASSLLMNRHLSSLGTYF